MKLSEAIREGAKLRPQARERYITKRKDGALCTCAIGAAYEALCGKLPPHDAVEVIPDEVLRLTGIDSDTTVELPDFAAHGFDDPEQFLFPAVFTLNDDYGWTREAIADWLEGQGY